MFNKDLVQKIKDHPWDNRVKRSGYLQSKFICAEAIAIPLELTKGIVAHYSSKIWVQDFALYDLVATNSIPVLFGQVFGVDPDWPVKIIDDLDNIVPRKDLFVAASVNPIKDREVASKIFAEYADILHQIQKYYVVAVPLTNYCENFLKKQNFDFSDYAIPYRGMDIDLYHKSLEQIKRVGSEKEELIEDNLKRFGWIKTAYNIIEQYTRAELDEALSGSQSEILHKPVPEGAPPELVGLQAGIYLRNRLKELAQQVWFAFEPAGLYLANELHLSREEFYSLLPSEVFEWLKLGKTVDMTELEDRISCFATGVLEEKPFVLSGAHAKEMVDFFNHTGRQDMTEFKGSVACRGMAKGLARVILQRSDFAKFNPGEILVAPMTTPDFILLMKKAAAVVTDEGGLSSHAAIVSRELNVPCVIGTKIATKVLKDGDEVEVDANKGVVHILKRA